MFSCAKIRGRFASCLEKISPISRDAAVFYTSALCSLTNSRTVKWVGDFVITFYDWLRAYSVHTPSLYHLNIWKSNIHVYSIVYLLRQHNYPTVVFLLSCAWLFDMLFHWSNSVVDKTLIYLYIDEISWMDSLLLYVLGFSCTFCLMIVGDISFILFRFIAFPVGNFFLLFKFFKHILKGEKLATWVGHHGRCYSYVLVNLIPLSTWFSKIN